MTDDAESVKTYELKFVKSCCLDGTRINLIPFAFLTIKLHGFHKMIQKIGTATFTSSCFRCKTTLKPNHNVHTLWLHICRLRTNIC